MKSVRSTIALVVILAGLSAYGYFVTSKKPDTESGPVREKAFPSIQTDKVDELRIKSESGEKTSLKKTDGAWQITEPVSVGADDTEVSGITNGLSQIEIVRVVDENPTDLKQYGLEGPRIQVEFKAPADKEFHRLFLGDKSPTGSDLFARREGEKRVVLVPVFHEQTFNRKTFDLRDKTLVKIDRDKIDGLDINAGGKTLQLAKTGSEWKFTGPLQARADFSAVEGMVGRVQSARMKSFVTNEASADDLKQYGLDKPAVTLQLSLGGSKATLLFGGKADDSSVYVRDDARPAVMTVDSALADDLKKGADEYRRKEVFEFRAATASRVEVTRGGQTVAFEKTAAKSGDNAPDKWRRVGPNAGDVDNDKLATFLAKLEGMRVQSFVESTAKAGLNAPALTVVATFGEAKKEDRVSFGKTADGVFAAWPKEPGAGKLDAPDFDDTLKKLDDVAK
jgi:hypothetical protein